MAWILTKEQIEKEAKSYSTLPFYKKSKNIYFGFIIYILFISVFLSAEQFNLSQEILIFVLFYNSVFAMFIYYNHRWAMAAFCLVYLYDRYISITQYNLGAPLEELFYAALSLSLTYRSIMVSNYLMYLEKNDFRQYKNVEDYTFDVTFVDKVMKYLQDFINGDITLWKSYWLVGVLLSLLAGFAIGLIGVMVDNQVVVGVLLIFWTIFISIGIWRSSDKYDGKQVWSILAKLAVILGMISNIITALGVNI